MYKSIILICLAFLFMANIKLSFRPFSVTLPNWREAIGITLIFSGVIVYYYAGYRKGANETIDKVIEIMNKEIEKNNNPSNETL